jgi:outer membrane receptor protein involved in Fe transport
MSLAFDDPQWLTANVQLRYLGRQFENDVNTLPMDDALLVDLFANWHVTSRVDVYLAVENLFDDEYLVGRSGVDTIGQPRFIHGGVRMRMGSARP